MEGAQPGGYLLDDAPHRFHVRPGIVDHPLLQRLPLDILRRDVQIVPLPRLRTGLEHVGIVDAAGDPFFHQEAFEIFGIVSQVDGRHLQGHLRPAPAVHREIEMAAGASVQLAHDLITVEPHPWLEFGGERQRRQLLAVFAGLLAGQAVGPDDLDRQVVITPLVERRADDRRGGLVQIIGVRMDSLDDEFLIGIFINSIGRKNQNVAWLQGHGAIFDLKKILHAQGAGQVALVFRYPQAVILGELFQAVSGYLIHTRIPHVEYVRRIGLDHQRGERAHVATVGGIAVGAVAGLQVQPGIGRLQHPLH